MSSLWLHSNPTIRHYTVFDTMTSKERRDTVPVVTHDTMTILSTKRIAPCLDTESTIPISLQNPVSRMSDVTAVHEIKMHSNKGTIW